MDRSGIVGVGVVDGGVVEGEVVVENEEQGWILTVEAHVMGRTFLGTGIIWMKESEV
jgi:hypothetical protein